MDRAWGSKPGSGGAASGQNEAIDRRDRLRRLALETINLAKDPYFKQNHYGTYECILCATLHNNEGNYLAHTQGKKHQTNLAKRAALEAKNASAQPQPQPHKRKVSVRRTVKIGRPGYRVTKQYDPELKQRSILFKIEYPEIEDNIKPRHRFMSSYEQKVQPYDKRYQYLLVAAEPYETISFKVPSTEIDKSTTKFFSHWDPDSKMFTLQVCCKPNKPQSTVGAYGLPLPPPPLPMVNELWPIPPPPPPGNM
ncbi:Matrin/U1-C-like C2H2-type zinc finger [Arabidopsis thaliana x Arabidopsis arenosa]|uniref:Matrin/U1-C-like C2H2-type zinc finger n=1 Tax=Arabidopsis thaliana x Arabidopsis arenosa TaxID=1240361 RepID=A0A8T1Y906_9BRAS|nr:Matrin/U1-C-like C2H2-type zinc finger [Arabidopsis thaliana x Arabidopsis arenosa]